MIPSSESEHFSSYSVPEQERRFNGGIRSILMATGRLEDPQSRESPSPLPFYSDRQLGMELDLNAGRHAGINVVGRHSLAPSPSLYHPTAEVLPAREFAFPNPAPSLATRGFYEQEARRRFPVDFPLR